MQKLLVLMSKNKQTANTLSTLSVFSSYTAKVFSQNHYAKIHSVFPNGFNLNVDGELIYMSAHQEGMLSARGVSIDQGVFDTISPHLNTGGHVRVKKDQLVFYTRPNIFTVNITDKQTKDLNVVPVTEEDLKTIDFITHLKGMGLLEKSGFTNHPMLMDILEDIQQTQEVHVNHVKQLIGAGVGLTPTGDDFLQGFMLMEQTLNHQPQVQTIVEKQLKERSTTEVSESYYDALFAGYSNEPLVLLFKAVLEEDRKLFDEALSLIQQYGETSGYDLLIGIVTYLQIL